MDKSIKKNEKEKCLEKLRKDRLKREEAEMVKSEALLKRHYGMVQESDDKSATSTDECVRPRK